MKIKAIIFDLDNTIYPVSSIGQKLFHSLFRLIENEQKLKSEIQKIKFEIIRRPFQSVAHDFGFSIKLTNECLILLSQLTYKEPILTFPDYSLTRQIDCIKFLVTTGFTNLQFSKIDNLGIRQDFQEIFIVDPTITNLNKRDIFQEIIAKYKLTNNEMVVIGDDINSEIKAGRDLGIQTVLFDFMNQFKNLENQIVVSNYEQLENVLTRI